MGRISLKVVSGSSRDEVVGWLGASLKVKVKAPPEKGFWFATPRPRFKSCRTRNRHLSVAYVPRGWPYRDVLHNGRALSCQMRHDSEPLSPAAAARRVRS
jgi:hypothetical protein